ncbi:YcbK family protein [Undibacterium arcticum]
MAETTVINSESGVFFVIGRGGCVGNNTAWIIQPYYRRLAYSCHADAHYYAPRLACRPWPYCPKLVSPTTSGIAPRELWLYRKSTGEQVRETYWDDGRIIPEGYIRLCKLLRDVQAGQAVQMDIILLDIMRGVYGWFEAYGVTKPLIINSGYRNVHTNAVTEGAARNSMHTYGKATDLWMAGISTEYMARLGVYLSGGGVGYYAQKKASCISIRAGYASGVGNRKSYRPKKCPLRQT